MRNITISYSKSQIYYSIKNIKRVYGNQSGLKLSFFLSFSTLSGQFPTFLGRGCEINYGSG